MQGHEVRDHIFARLFGLVSVIQSGLLLRDSTLPSSGSSHTAASTLRDFQTVAQELLILAEKKSWIRETCWWALDMALAALFASDVMWKNEAITWLSEIVYADHSAWTPEKLAFTIKLQATTSKLAWKKLLSPPFKDTDILSTKNIPTVARILKVSWRLERYQICTNIGHQESEDADETSELKTGSPGTWKPQLHFVWSTVFGAYFPPEGSPPSNASTFQEFYRTAVDGMFYRVHKDDLCYLIRRDRDLVLEHCISRAQVLGFFSVPTCA